MSIFKLQALVKSKTGKSNTAKYRSEGYIIGNYSKADTTAKKVKNVGLLIEPKNLRKLFDSPKKLNTLVEIDTEDGSLKSAHALVSDIQLHPLKGTITHIDFRGIEDGQVVNATVPVKYVGKAKGLEAGGVLRIISKTLNIKAKAIDIPAELNIDLTEIALGGHLLITDVAMPAGVSPIYKSLFSLAVIDIPKAVAEEAPAAAKAAAPAAAAGKAAPAAAPAAGKAAAAKPAAKPAAKK